MSPASTGTPAPDPSGNEPTYTPNLPFGQLELATLALSAATFWQTSALGDLLWKTKAAFLTQAQAYFDSLDSADAAQDGRGPQAQRLRTLDAQIDKALGFVKGYLAEDHDGDADEAYYDEFGIRAEGRNQRLPSARPARAKALAKLVAALHAHGYDDRKYGKAFWKPIATEYADLVGQRAQTESAAAGETGQKNAQEKPLRKVLKALINLIKAHYPDTYKNVLREFGFQKEGY
ncbi:hypothetical protein [Hymenobacter armeniacus]|uniref:Uncharacterized protein n=1 Tax=Hymenobacter armeniacus TaxID=2771358 RepID=A0ABR8JYU2_9BACT|nr:hypothetical protein [Hymenobacter armeniacus]MBD2723820.1 hypothetical protein [Hymenobacter armeniacus]